MNRISKIIETIEKNPGIKFREIMRETGMKNGVIAYYTKNLEKKGSVKVERGRRQTRFYPIWTTNDESVLIKYLRQETSRDMLLALLCGDLTFYELVNKVHKSPSTVSMNLTQLIQCDMIESISARPRRIFRIKDIEKIRKIIDKYNPDLLEKTSDRLADTFSSL